MAWWCMPACSCLFKLAVWFSLGLVFIKAHFADYPRLLICLSKELGSCDRASWCKSVWNTSSPIFLQEPLYLGKLTCHAHKRKENSFLCTGSLLLFIVSCAPFLFYLLDHWLIWYQWQHELMIPWQADSQKQ